MGRRAGRTIALSVVIGAATLAACTPAPTPPPAQTTSAPTTPFVATSCTAAQAAGASTASAPLSEPEAEAEAIQEFADAPDTVGETPLVTVERHGNDITVTTTDVATAAEAADVAAAAAEGSDLVSVEVAEPVHALEDVPSGVSSVSNDTRRPEQWALDQAAFESVWATSDGDGVIVAVVDTGVQASHPDLAGQVLPGYQYWGSVWNGTRHEGVMNPSYDDNINSHGTHVAGIIAAVANNAVGVTGAAPGVKILPVKVLDSQGNGNSGDVADGIDWAVDNGADIVSLSLGGGHSTDIAAAVNSAVAQGVLVLAAAGNDGPAPDPPSYPGAEANAIAVASVTSTLADSSFSTTGDYVDLAAPGSSILSTVVDNNPASPTYSMSGYGYLSGTSMATPYAAAEAALLVSANPTWTVAQLRERLLTTANDLGVSGQDAEFGCGFIDPLEAVS